MEDAEKDQEDERLDIQAIYSTTINEFRRGLRQWLEKERDEEEENGDFEDRELDALLLKIEIFQEQPNLLDSALQSLIDPLLPFLSESVESGFTVHRQKCFRIIYHYTKIRGYKVTVRFLPNEVYLLEPVLAALSTPNLQWQTTYILILWLSLICLAPFDLASIESSTATQSLVARLLAQAKRGLGSPGKERDASAILYARVLSRRDVWREELTPFMAWTIDVFSSLEENTLLKTGILSTISTLLSHSERQVGQSIIPQALEILRLTDSGTIQSNALARKLRVKIMQRIGIIEIPSTARDHEDINVPETVEEVLDFLLSSISDRDTIVRYTAAKAVSRIVLSLPPSYSNEIISILFQKMDEGLVKTETDFDFSSVDESTWHGSLLCLADIAWHSGLHELSVPPTITYSLNALTFDFVKGQKPVGNAVRDAACYVLYAIVRTCPPTPTSPLTPFILPIAVRVVCIATLDPSTTIRRAASAAFQELVGRQSAREDRVPAGIKVLSMMDYHAVGSRRGGMEVAVQVARTTRVYRKGVVEWCVERGVGHWEEKGREGVAKVLGRIFEESREGVEDVLRRLAENLSGLDVFRIHGSLSAIGELILTLSDEDIEMNPTFYEDLQLCLEKLPAYTKKSVHANLVTIASLRFIQCISASRLPISSSTIQTYITIIEMSLQKNNESVQEAASDALGSLSNRFAVSDNLQKWLVNLRSKSTFTVRRGWATALGHIRIKGYTNVLLKLCDAIEKDGDIEVKRNATKSVGTIFSREDEVEDCSLVTRIWSILTSCLDDYTVDSRGDVGSWIRMAACESLVPVFKNSSQLDVRVTVGKLLRLSVEKMDKVRTVAGRTLCALVPQWTEAEGSLKEFVAGMDEDMFAVPSKVFPAAVQLLSLELYRAEILTGFVISAGGLGESLTRTASVTLADYLDSISEQGLMATLKCFEEILRVNLQNDRVIIPAIETIAGLLEENIFSRIESEYNFRTLFILTQKVGFKSSNVMKLLACVRMYTALLSIDVLRNEVLRKLLSMLLHPLPRVRVVVADALFLNLQGEEEGKILGDTEWSSERSHLKESVQRLEELALN